MRRACRPVEGHECSRLALSIRVALLRVIPRLSSYRRRVAGDDHGDNTHGQG